MRLRVLDGDRSCLAGLPVTDLAKVMPAERVRTVVVEEDGQVVGTMTVALVPHVEATWIHPDHRNAGVSRALWRRTLELAREGGAEWGFGSASDQATDGILGRLGGTQVPARFYLLPLGEKVPQERSRSLETPVCEPAGRV